jgi:hypothetical protein
MTQASSSDHEALGPSQEPAIDKVSFMIVLVLTAFFEPRQRVLKNLAISHAEIRGVSSSVLA